MEIVAITTIVLLSIVIALIIMEGGDRPAV